MPGYRVLRRSHTQVSPFPVSSVKGSSPSMNTGPGVRPRTALKEKRGLSEMRSRYSSKGTSLAAREDQRLRRTIQGMIDGRTVMGNAYRSAQNGRSLYRRYRSVTAPRLTFQARFCLNCAPHRQSPSSGSALAFRGFGMPPSQDPLYAGLGQAVRIGTELLAALIVGGGLGWVIDAYLLESAPWGLVVGGFRCGGRYQEAYRSAQRWQVVTTE